MKMIKQTYHIQAPIRDVWNALIDPLHINNWGGGPATMSDKEGTLFSLWGGDIHGKNINIKTERLLKQEWYGGDWEKPSIVTFILKEEKNGTRIDLLHQHVPDNEAKDIDAGWNDYYLGAIKQFLEH